MRLPRSFALLVVVLISTFTLHGARADEPVDPDVDARLAFIETRLDAGDAAANRWSYAWLATFGGLALIQAGVALGTTSTTLRKDAAVGSVAASMGVVPFGLFAFAPRLAAPKLRAWPNATPEERKRKLVRAEALLKKSAEAEKFGRSWVPHVLGDGVAVAWGFVLALGYKRVSTGIIAGAVGVGLVETQIWTQPTRAIDDWREYSQWKSHHPVPAKGASLSITAGEGGLSLLGRF